ncbi:hypothetical protein B0E48_11795 [Rhodanobacter sp. C03]|nr:hypothetical protein B0E48_11795 [Rhodanobacter sp. C03]
MAGTTGCGICLSFFVTKLTQRTLALPQRESLALLALTIFASGTLLWLVDTLLQASTVVGGWTLRSFAIRRYNWVYFNLLFGFQIIVLALIQSTRSLAQREKELVEAQLAALRFQVNPHFLFNTLNAISTLISERNGDAAEEMIAKLADFFSATLHADLSALVPLGRELETVQAYLDIETVRFGDRLHVEYRFDELSVVASVPSLILQPLVENAIKYAVAPTIAGATIVITAHVIEQELIITVEDYATTASPRDHKHSGTGAGLGLRNVAQRLQTQYGQAGSLETKKVDDGFLATIRLPISQGTHWRKA